MQTLKINLLKLTGIKTFTAKDGAEYIAIPIVQNGLFKSEKGIYLDLALIENKDGRDRFDNDGFAKHDISKERRDAGERGPILGNWKHLTPKGQAPQQQQKPAPKDDFQNYDENDDIPF